MTDHRAPSPGWGPFLAIVLAIVGLTAAGVVAIVSTRPQPDRAPAPAPVIGASPSPVAEPVERTSNSTKTLTIRPGVDIWRTDVAQRDSAVLVTPDKDVAGRLADRYRLDPPPLPVESVAIKAVGYTMDRTRGTLTIQVRLADLTSARVAGGYEVSQEVLVDVGRTSDTLYILGASTADPARNSQRGMQFFESPTCNKSLRQAKPRTDFAADRIRFVVDLDCVRTDEVTHIKVSSSMWARSKEIYSTYEVANDTAREVGFILKSRPGEREAKPAARKTSPRDRPKNP